MAHLRRGLVRARPRLPWSHGLRRLTRSLEHGLALGEAAQQTFSVAARRASAAVDPAVLRRMLGRIRARGLSQLRRSENAMATFSLGANKLGAALFAQAS